MRPATESPSWSPQRPKEERERLLVGWCGGSETLIAAIRFCRLACGSIVHRERGVLVVEVCDTPDRLDTLIAQLPETGVTHLNRAHLRP